jgi:Protein of unknown function (DUF1573)
MIYMGRIGMALIGVLVLAAVCRSVTLKVERHSASEAILYIPQRSIDLGTLNTREVRYYTFELLNQGRRRLVINQLDDCGCGEPEQATVVIAPGEYGQVSVRRPWWVPAQLNRLLARNRLQSYSFHRIDLNSPQVKNRLQLLARDRTGNWLRAGNSYLE